MPAGFALPNNATVIASNPNEPATPAVKAYSPPKILKEPPNPAKPPQTAITIVITMSEEIPAVVAAFEFKPVARNLKP